MIPRTIVAQPDNLSGRPDPDIIPLPGSRRPERDMPAQPRPPAAAHGGGEFGPRDILNALRYHSVLFVTLGSIAAAGLFAAAWTLVPPKYTTYATLFVDQRIPTVLPAGVGGNEDGNFATYLKTQAAFIKNRRTIGGALLNPKNGIAQLSMLRDEEDPSAFLEERILIDLTDTSNSALRVALAGDDPVQITKIVNAVVHFYMDEVTSWRKEKAQRISTLEKTRGEWQQMLANKLKHFETQFATPGTGEPGSFKQKLRMSAYLDLLRQQGAARNALANARGVLKGIEAKVAEFDAKPPTMPADVLTAWVDKDQEVMMKEMAVKRLDRDARAIAEQSATLTPKYYEMKQRAVVAARELEGLKQKVRTKVESTYLAGKRFELAAQVERAQDEVKRIEALDQGTAEQLVEYKDFKDLNEAAIETKLAEKIPEDDDIRSYRAEIERVSASIMHLRADLDAPDRVRIWQDAEVPTKKDIRKQAAISGVAGIAGLGLVGGLVTVYEMRRKRVFGPTDPLFRQKLPLLGCLPECAAPASAKTDAIDPAGRAFFEAVDKVKAVVCRALQRRKMQALLVTSAAPGEGKSALAWHLALSLARSDRRTLFIDGNLRSPGLHNHFDIASHPGLSELLRGERTVAEVVQRTALDNLWCIAAGVCDETGRQALDKETLRQVLDRARRDFDYVVIDSCSLREAVDPLYLAQRADATILAVRAFHSGTTDVERVCDRLTQMGTPLLGAILTDPTGAGCEL
jgi:succinoglycan biosynthesis transport protein ExoP